MSRDLTHLDDHGKARIVDISDKPATRREASAQAVLRMQPQTRQMIESNTLAKGDALAVARIAGILAAKRVDNLIPLCHTLPISTVQVDFKFDERGLVIRASAATTAQTGVEMEALTAATIAALTVYDMAKAVDKAMVIEDVHLLKKTGGKSGDFEWSQSGSES